MNYPTIQRTTFVNHPSGEKTYGYRTYDDESQVYDNTLGEECLTLTPLEFLRKIVKGEYPMSDDLSEMLAFVEENHMGMFIDGDFFTAEDLAPILTAPELR